MEEQQNSVCPFCAESIMPDAIKCKHCGEWLQPKLMKADLQSEVTHRPTIRCRRCSDIIPITWNVTSIHERLNAKCPSCGNSPYSFPIVTQILIGLIIPILVWLIFFKIFG